MPLDATLAREWEPWKSFQLADTALTAREKHLIGLGVAARCPYCTYFLRNAAQMMGASDAQIEDHHRTAAAAFARAAGEGPGGAPPGPHLR